MTFDDFVYKGPLKSSAPKFSLDWLLLILFMVQYAEEQSISFGGRGDSSFY